VTAEQTESIVKWAMAVAESLPEKYQQAAFAELLRHALNSTSGFTVVDTVTPVRTGSQ